MAFSVEDPAGAENGAWVATPVGTMGSCERRCNLQLVSATTCAKLDRTNLASSPPGIVVAFETGTVSVQVLPYLCASPLCPEHST